MPIPENGTLLILNPFGVPVYSGRNLTQTLQPIEPAISQWDRDLNGDFVDLSFDQFKKYRTIIICTDLNSPALDGVWPGALVTINCVVELSYKTVGGSPSRTVVFGSMRTKGDHTFYRPSLNMFVTSYNWNKAEYRGDVAWTLEAEET